MSNRKKKPDSLFDKIKDKVVEARTSGETFSKIAIEKGREGFVAGTEKGKKVSKKGVKEIRKSISSAKNAMSSKNEIIEMIEKLGRLKESGFLTDEEFQNKKKELLAKI